MAETVAKMVRRVLIDFMMTKLVDCNSTDYAERLVGIWKAIKERVPFNSRLGKEQNRKPLAVSDPKE